MISACEKGAQWERAREVFEEMKAAGMKPDVISYNAMISACEKGAQWERAREVFEEMKAAGVKPDRPTYNPLLTVLWQCGQRRTAMDLYLQASAAGVYPRQAELVVKMIDLHDMSPGAAQVVLTLWLDAIAARWAEQPASVPARLKVVTGQGHHKAGESEVKDAVVSFLAALGSPFEVPRDNPGCLKADGAAVAAWLRAQGSITQRMCVNAADDA
jgi:pentatricopeptide repeat protein